MAQEYQGEVIPMKEYTGEVIPIPKVGAGDTAKKELPWSKVATEAISNAPGSVWNMVKGVAEAIASPVETVKGVIDVGAGALQNVLPVGLVDLVNRISPSESAAEARKKASLVGAHYVKKYGSIEGFKEALASDPAGVMADASTVLTGGAGVLRTAGMATRSGALTSAADALTTASRATDPLLQTVRGAQAAARPVGSGVASVLGGIGTHTGGESIRQVAQAGFEGGRRAEVAAGQMRGTMPVSDLLDEARTAFDNLRMQRGQDYVRNMQQITGNPQVIPFNQIDSAVQNALNIKTFRGVSTSPTTARIQDQIRQTVGQWRNLNPNDYHTIAGMDALKQSIGDIRDATQFGSPERRVADTVYNAIRSEINAIDPRYAQAMRQYSEASETISEIQRHLLGGERGSAVTAMRKLQNLMTAGGKNKDLERNLIRDLEQAGAGNLSAGLAGLSMQDFVPRMLSGRLGAGLGTAIVAANNPAVAVGLLPLQSPRLVGEAALATGRAAGLVNRGVQGLRSNAPGMLSGQPIDNYLYQMNLLNQVSEGQQQ